MLVVRKSTLSDIDQLLELSAQAGVGMTTMPNDRESWIEKLQRSENDFSKQTEKPNGDIYFLVLEDTLQKKIVGSCGVYPGVGLNRPFYTYKLSTITKSCEKLGLLTHSHLLTLVNDYAGSTELGSLFILPEYRKNGVGKFLSRSRLMLIADFPERFDQQVFAEFRGWLDKNNESPFWEGLTSKFFGLSYQKADFISAVDGSQFISDLMPEYPIYVDLLSQTAQEVIGKANIDAVGAVKILEKEGFQYSGYVDIFDAGPCMQNNIDHINTVKNSNICKVIKILSDADSEINDQPLHIVSNSHLQNYQIVCQSVRRVGGEVMINQSTASNLNISIGSSIRCIEL